LGSSGSEVGDPSGEWSADGPGFLFQEAGMWDGGKAATHLLTRGWAPCRPFYVHYGVVMIGKKKLSRAELLAHCYEIVKDHLADGRLRPAH